MKKYLIPCTAVLFLMMTYDPAQCQTKKVKGNVANWPKQQQHIPIDSFPSGKMINFIEGWGGNVVAVNSIPKGTNMAPLLAGLKNNSCQVPHWGYIIKGALRLKYDSGEEVVLKTGDLFYMAPGHTATVDEDVKLLDFSPQGEFKDLVAHMEKKVTEMGKK